MTDRKTHIESDDLIRLDTLGRYAFRVSVVWTAAWFALLAFEGGLPNFVANTMLLQPLFFLSLAAYSATSKGRLRRALLRYALEHESVVCPRCFYPASKPLHVTFRCHECGNTWGTQEVYEYMIFKDERRMPKPITDQEPHA